MKREDLQMGSERRGPRTTLAASRPTGSRWFYVGMTILVILVNVAAFGPSLVDPSTRTVPLPLDALTVAHSAVAATWLLVFLVQVTLVATGRTAVHRQLGILVVLLTVAFMVVTWFALVAGARRGFDLSGDLVPRGTTVDPGTYLVPASGLVALGALVGAAMWHRRRPALHKRLMMLALVSSTGAAVAHLIGHWRAFAPLVFIGSILLGFLPAIHDRVWEGRIHPVSLWGAIGLAFWTPFFIFIVAPTPAWQSFAEWVIK